MTKAQKIVYDEIIRFIFENNYSPTVRELTRLCGYSSTSTIAGILSRLKKQVYIDMVENCPRTIQILK